MGYLLMKSEKAKADRIQGIVDFSRTLRKQPVHIDTAERLYEKYKFLFQKTHKRAMTKARTDPINITNAEAFIDRWEMYQNIISFPVDHIINADETLLRATKDGVKVERLEASYKAGGSDVLDDATSIGSLTPFVSAAGTIWLLVYCLKIPKTKSKEEDKPVSLYIPLAQRQQKSENSAHGILIFGNSTGLLNGELWDRSMKKLIQIIRNASSTPQKEIALFTDNLGVHRGHETIRYAFENELYQLYFPPNCSHWIQPLDNLCFALLQLSIRKLCGEKYLDCSF